MGESYALVIRDIAPSARGTRLNDFAELAK